MQACINFIDNITVDVKATIDSMMHNLECDRHQNSLPLRGGARTPAFNPGTIIETTTTTMEPINDINYTFAKMNVNIHTFQLSDEEKEFFLRLSVVINNKIDEIEYLIYNLRDAIAGDSVYSNYRRLIRKRNFTKDQKNNMKKNLIMTDKAVKRAKERLVNQINELEKYKMVCEFKLKLYLKYLKMIE